MQSECLTHLKLLQRALLRHVRLLKLAQTLDNEAAPDELALNLRHLALRAL